MVTSLSQSALTGIQRGLQQVTDAASEIATADRTIDVGDLASSLVDLKMGQQQVEASAKVVKVDDQLRGTLLDIKV
jgi:flagellar hook protein FlgE